MISMRTSEERPISQSMVKMVINCTNADRGHVVKRSKPEGTAGPRAKSGTYGLPAETQDS